MLQQILNTFEACGVDYKGTITTEELDEVIHRCTVESKGEISYGKFKSALYMAGIKLDVKTIRKRRRGWHSGAPQPVIWYDSNGKYIKGFDSIGDAARYIEQEYGILAKSVSGGISAVLRGKLKTYKGWTFERAQK